MNNYYLIIKGKQKGPYTQERVHSMWVNKSIAAGTLCLKEGESKPRPIEQFSEITSSGAKGKPSPAPKSVTTQQAPCKAVAAPPVSTSTTGVPVQSTSGSDVFAGCLVFACLAVLAIFAFVWGWSFWTYVGLAIAAVIAQVVIELVYDNVLGNKTKKNVPWFLHLPFGASILLLVIGLLYLPYSLIFGPSGAPLNGIYSYKFGSGSAFSIKFREDGSVTYVATFQGSSMVMSQWTQERRGSTVTLNAKSPKVKTKRFEMTIQENGNLRRVTKKGKVEIYVKEGD